MDLPPFLHQHQHQHHHRYVPVPPPRPHRPPVPQLHENPNFYGHHHLHHHLPAPPVPPPPQPSSHRPLPAPPPPPPYNPHLSQFTFRNPNSSIDDHPDFNLPPPRVFENDQRVRRRLPETDYLADSRRDIWEPPPRVLPENRSIRPYNTLDLDHEFRHREPMSPYRAVDKLMHGSEGSSRFREDFQDGILQDRRAGLVWDRIIDCSDDDYRYGGHLASNHDKSSRNFVSSDSDLNFSLREFAENSGSFDSPYGSEYESDLFAKGREDRVRENQRRGSSRQTLRILPDSSFEMGTDEFNDNSEVRGFHGKKVARVSEFGNFDSRGSGEGTQEYDHTPRKKLQKKSAFLRIQMGKSNYRNRDDARLLSSSYYGEPNSGTFKGKDLPAYSNRRIEEDGGERARSPVQLDVSFKSNSLVAKAILAPSSPVINSDRNSTPVSNRKIRKLTLPVMDNSNSPKDKSIGSPVKLENTFHVSDNVSDSVKDMRHSDTKATDCSGGTSGDVCSKPRSCWTGISLKKTTLGNSHNATVSPKVGSNVGSGGNSGTKVTKKKVVKKVMTPRPSLANSKPAKKHSETVKEDSFAHSSSAASRFNKGLIESKEKSTSDGTVSGSGVVLEPCAKEVKMLTESNKLDGPPQDIVSEELADNTCSDKVQFPEAVKKRNSLTTPLGLSNPEESEKKEDAIHIDSSVHDLRGITSSDSALSQLEDNTNSPDIGSLDDVNKHTFQNGISELLEKDEVKGNTQVMFTGTNFCVGLSRSEESKINKADNDLTNHERITVSDIDAEHDDCKRPCLNQVSASSEPVLMGGFSKNVSPIYLSDSEENTNHDCPLSVDRANPVGVMGLSSDNSPFNFQNETTFPNSGTVDYFQKQLYPDEAPLSIKDDFKESSTQAAVSVGGIVTSGEDCTSNKIMRREHGSPQSNSLNLNIGDICARPVSRASYADDLDITLNSSFRNSSRAAAEHCTDGIRELQPNNSLEGFSEVDILFRDGVNISLNGISPKFRKKRKLFISHTELSGPPVSLINEGAATADTSTSGAEVPLNFNHGLPQPDVGLPISLKGNTVLHENIAAGDFIELLSSVGDGFRDDGSKQEQQSTDCGSLVNDSAIPNVLSSCPLGSGGEKAENTTSNMVTTNQQNVYLDMESMREEYTNLPSPENQAMITRDIVQCKIPSENQTPDSDQRVCSADMECDSYLPVKKDSPSVLKYMSLSTHGDGVCTAKCSDEEMDSLPDTSSNMENPENLSILPGAGMVSSKIPLHQTSNEVISGDEQKPEQKTVVRVYSNAVKVLPRDIKNASCSQNPASGGANRKKNQQSHTAPRIYPGRSSVYFTKSEQTASSTLITKHRTWCRTGNPSAASLPGKKSSSSVLPPLSQSSQKMGKVQSTIYIRKGNSLVRKPSMTTALSKGSHGSSSSIYQSNPSGIDAVKKSKGSDSKDDVPDLPNSSRKGGTNAALQMARTPILPLSPGDSASSPLAEPVISCCSETTSEPMRLIEDKNVVKSSEDVPKINAISENESDPVKSSESQGVENGGNAVSSSSKNVIYVKRKLNQLVAASNPRNLSWKSADKTQASSGFYRRKKNQLIRKLLGSHMNQQVSVHDDNSNTSRQRSLKLPFSGTCDNRSTSKVGGTRKPSKLSLVWTLRGTQSSREVDNTLQHQKVLPYLFPWKRAKYWKKVMQNSSTISSNSSLSMISRKLLLLRKRDTVYTRSTHGFSLRKSKVLSVGGRNLKWSKSIEKHAKKANEEATLAVAAVEKKKREQNTAAGVVSGAEPRFLSARKSANGIKLHPGERIYRIGSVRYKMDSSRRTLQRITDDDESFSAALQEKDVKKSYVPRRLVIGNEEYVRIGNGNQLVRDPKRRIRTLASEKVRWSLHTARLCLARKRKYCQFFTRFGKCNKDDGKCPYIHDPSKIAVCTKFLKGLCTNPDCKLTHKVIPERMQDCSYFLQGLCSNKNCPYRHVKVNPNASTCEGFLKGYCADGNECQKKHSYVCPDFEASGLCPMGSKCKLHHPKTRSKGKKRKRSKEEIPQGRYFGSPHVNAPEPGSVVSGKRSRPDNDDIVFADYISLDVADEVAEDTVNRSKSFGDSDSSDVPLDDLDELVIPFRLINGHTVR